MLRENGHQTRIDLSDNSLSVFTTSDSFHILIWSTADNFISNSVTIAESQMYSMNDSEVFTFNN